ncbi:hypothetical protein [Corallococcus sicarius]|uniref:hypothetical protein n=1 Tax=Corallococcus sicarius TaxID=2316726 RepID=UPI001315866F|nr:hypothetical protein [Corallococcus sicarius]
MRGIAPRGRFFKCHRLRRARRGRGVGAVGLGWEYVGSAPPKSFSELYDLALMPTP